MTGGVAPDTKRIETVIMNHICIACGKKVPDVRRERCETCYRRHIAALKESGQFVPLRAGRHSKPAIDRVLNRITPGWGGCWIFTGHLDSNGYGLIHERKESRTALAHRVTYAHLVGPLPAGTQLDHLCHSTARDCPSGQACTHRRCVNPAHLEIVSSAENTYRGNSFAGINKRKTHCIHGHEFTPENTWVRKRSPDANPERACKRCERERNRRNARKRSQS